MSRTQPVTVKKFTRSKKVKRDANLNLHQLVREERIYPINTILPPEMIGMILNKSCAKQKVINASTCEQWFDLTKFENLVYIRGYKHVYEKLFNNKQKMSQIERAQLSADAKSEAAYIEQRWFLTKILTSNSCAKLKIKISDSTFFNFLLRIKFQPQPEAKILIKQEPVIELMFWARADADARTIKLEFSSLKLFLKFQARLDEKRNLTRCVKSIAFKETSNKVIRLSREFISRCRSIEDFDIEFTRPPIDTSARLGYVDFILNAEAIVRNNNNIKQINIFYNQNIVEKITIINRFPDWLYNFIFWITERKVVNSFKFICGQKNDEYLLLKTIKNVKHLIIEGSDDKTIKKALNSLCENENLTVLESINLACCINPIEEVPYATFENQLIHFLQKNVNVRIISIKNILLSNECILFFNENNMTVRLQ